MMNFRNQSSVFIVKKIAKAIFLLCMFSGISLNGFSQINLEFRHLKEKDGLSNNLVNCFLKDKNGFLWVGTFDGLNRFDGNNFAHFKKNRKNKNSIQSNVIYDLAEDHDGYIWFSTAVGIGFYDQEKQQFNNFLSFEGKPFGLVYNLLCDRDGDIWFTGDYGLYHYSKKTGTYEHFKHDVADPQSILSGTISKNGMLEDPHKKGLWLSSNEGLMYFDIETRKFFHYQNNPQNLAVFNNEPTSAIALSRRNEIAFGKSYNEVIVFDLTTLKVKKRIALFKKFINHKYDVLFKFDLSAIFFDAQNNIWISTFAFELFFVDNKTQQVHEFYHSESEKGSISSNFFFAAYQYDDGTIMLGTVDGISYTNPEKDFFHLHRIAKKLPNLEINEGFLSFFEDDDGGWWLGTETDGLIKYNSISGETITYPFISRINSIAKAKGQLLLGTGKGFYAFDLKNKRFLPLKLPTEVVQNTVAISNVFVQNDTLAWLSGAGQYIVRFNPVSREMTAFEVINEVKTEAGSAGMPSVFADKKNEVWASTDWGTLFKFSVKKQKFIPVKSLENNDFENHFYQPKVDKNNNFWIPCLRNGLAKYDPKSNKFTLLGENDGLASELIRYIEIDHSGQIWAAAYNKFSVIDPAKKSFRNFTLPINETNYDYETFTFLLRNGGIVCIMKGTLVEFSPEKFSNNVLDKKPLINFLSFGDHTQYMTSGNDEIRMGVEDNSFSIFFGLLPLPQSNKYQFLYKLEGVDKTWKKSSENATVAYTNIPGGDYVFQLKALTGNSESKISQLKIHVDTYFYKTSWFLSLITLIFLGLSYAFYRYRFLQSSRIHLMQLQTTALEKDKTEIQYQSLINQLNPHFLFNSLTSLNSLITINPGQASAFLEKLSLIYRYILQNKGKNWVGLEQEIRFVQHYIDLQKSRFEDGLQIEIDVDKKYYSKNIVPVTIQNLIENAIKHNIIDDDAPLYIKVYVENNYLLVVNNIQKKQFVETSNKQGLESLKILYKYLSPNAFEIIETDHTFIAKVPLL